MKVHRAAATYEDSSLILLARLEDPSTHVPALIADFSSITLSIYDKANPRNKVVPDVTLTISQVIFDTLQINPTIWKLDSIGFNFKLVTLAAWLPAGDRVYRFSIKFAFPGDKAAHAGWDVPTIDLLRS